MDLPLFSRAASWQPVEKHPIPVWENRRTPFWLLRFSWVMLGAMGTKTPFSSRC
jgi:hypothetical protein